MGWKRMTSSTYVKIRRGVIIIDSDDNEMVRNRLVVEQVLIIGAHAMNSLITYTLFYIYISNPHHQKTF